MRIRPATWLAATALWAGVARSADNVVIQFQNADFQYSNTDPDLGIISVNNLTALVASGQTKNFQWNSKGVVVSQINLHMLQQDFATAENNATSDSTTTVDSTAAVTPTSSAHHNHGSQSMDRHGRRQGEGMMTPIRMSLNASEFMGVVAVQPADLIADVGVILNSRMYFEAVWANNQGSSYSRVFTVSKDDGNPAVFDGLKEEYSDTSPAKNESSPSPTDTSPTTGVSQVPSESTATSTGGSSSSPSPSGLSTGAIAGIAVACGVVGLALVGALLWFFCRKRRQDGSAPYGEVRNRTQELMAEKEATAGAETSPHSPYSDDGHLRGLGHPNDSFMAGGVAGAPAAAEYPHHQQPIGALDRSYTPYSDQPIGSVGSPGTQRASLVPQQAESALPPEEHDTDSHHGPGGIRSATAASQYAHLVEDGMTADDIRRIEEEERQLDAAIERAGGRRGS